MPIKNKDIILNGWNVARIREALDEVLERLSDLDPHQDIDSILTTAWKVSKYGVISGPYFPIFRLNTGKYGPEITPYLESGFTNASETYVNEYCIKKDKNWFKFLFKFHDFPEIPKMLQTHALEKFTFQCYREIEMSRNVVFLSKQEIKMLQNIVFWSNREINMLRNILFGLKREVKMLWNSNVAQKIAKLKYRENSTPWKFLALKYSIIYQILNLICVFY